MAASDEEALSPKNRLKFLCSFGGRILPRPTDGLLKYVGGETRALSVPRSISFSELKEKVDGMFNADVVIKFQILTEDLDALVSVRSEEDLGFMIEEYDRHERQPRSPTSTASHLFRLFLFPTAAVASTAPTSPVAVGYSVDARPIFTLSADTSPTQTIDAGSCTHAALLVGGRGAAGGVPGHPDGGMHRVRSTPNLGGSPQSQLAGTGMAASPRVYNRHMHPQHCTGHVVPSPTWRGFPGGPPVLSQLPPLMMPRYWYPPLVPGPVGGVCWGHGGGNDGSAARSGQGLHSSGAPSPQGLHSSGAPSPR